MTGGGHPNLKALFDAAFHAPCAAGAWRTARGRAKWIDGEIWLDHLAGPVHAIVHDGSCAYGYARDDAYFTGVSDPASLGVRLRGWHGALVDAIGDFSPASPDEAADAEAMHRHADAIRAVVELALEVERERWLRNEAAASLRR